MQPTHAGGIIVNLKGEILLVLNKLGYWTFPRGHIEKNEDILEAAKREVKEETGVENLEYVGALGTYERRRLNKPEVIMVTQMYLFKTSQDKVQSQDDQNPDAKWFRKENVVNALTAQGDKDFFTQKQNLL
ncbi:MAG: NUDIX hydrolase [Candidatus Levybacteria bacterium]|nr:NUDIX hydrolase [Candidatus Levybacteria bacterium]